MVITTTNKNSINMDYVVQFYTAKLPIDNNQDIDIIVFSTIDNRRFKLAAINNSSETLIESIYNTILASINDGCNLLKIPSGVITCLSHSEFISTK